MDSRKPQQKPPEQQKKNANRPQLPTPVDAFIRTRVRPIIKFNEPYITKEFMRQNGITGTDLDFGTGMSSGEQFFVPMPKATVDELLKKYKPWETNDDKDVGPDEPEFAHWNDPCTEARFFLSFIRHYLTWNNDPSGLGPAIIPNHAPWGHCRYESKYLRRRPFEGKFEGLVEWQSWGCQQTIQQNGEPRHPHIICFVGDQNPLRRYLISTSEMTAIMVLAGICMKQPVNWGYRIIPVTVISCSYRAVRIAQGIVNVPKLSVEVRVSQIVDFEAGVRKNWDDFLALLGWFAASPTGKTD